MDTQSFSYEMQQYFSSLPVYVQENLAHSDVSPDTLRALRQCAHGFETPDGT